MQELVKEIALKQKTKWALDRKITEIKRVDVRSMRYAQQISKQSRKTRSKSAKKYSNLENSDNINDAVKYIFQIYFR